MKKEKLLTIYWTSFLEIRGLSTNKKKKKIFDGQTRTEQGEDCHHKTPILINHRKEIGSHRSSTVKTRVPESMAGTGSSMLYSLLLFIIILSLQEMYRGKLASSELFTILGGFTSSVLFVMLLTFIGNYQETIGIKTGWGAVIFAEAVALIAASTVHRVCITTCFLFSAGLLYEVNKLSGMMLSRSESKMRRH
ncbi:hypothetical protein CsSME_00014832 [Camellia sinensis var. sinensis]